jgi:type II secretion system protein I
MTHRANQRGFTLLEVMAALAVLSIAMVTLIRSQTQSLNDVRRIQAYERGVFITENQLHWTFLDLNEAERWQDYAELSGVDGDYRWKVTIQPRDMEVQADIQVTMLEVVAETTWPEGRNGGYVRLETWYLWGREQ